MTINTLLGEVHPDHLREPCKSIGFVLIPLPSRWCCADVTQNAVPRGKHGWWKQSSWRRGCAARHGSAGGDAHTHKRVRVSVCVSTPVSVRRSCLCVRLSVRRRRSAAMAPSGNRLAQHDSTSQPRLNQSIIGTQWRISYFAYVRENYNCYFTKKIYWTN